MFMGTLGLKSIISQVWSLMSICLLWKEPQRSPRPYSFTAEAATPVEGLVSMTCDSRELGVSLSREWSQNFTAGSRTVSMGWGGGSGDKVIVEQTRGPEFGSPATT